MPHKLAHSHKEHNPNSGSAAVDNPNGDAHTLRMERLKAIREAAGHTQQSLAAEAGIHHTTITKLENGSKGASLDMIYKISAALNIEASELFNPPKKYARVIEILQTLSPGQIASATQALEAIAKSLRQEKAPQE